MDYILRKQISLLIELAMADNIFDISEKAYLMKFAASHGVRNVEVMEMIEKPAPFGTLDVLNLTQKMDLLLSCGKVVLADGLVATEEKAFLHIVARKMGFRKAVVDYLLKNIDTLPEKELKEGFLDFVL